MLLKASGEDFLGRFREVISDPLNVLIDRVPNAGFFEKNLVVLHNGLRVPAAGPGAYYGPFSQLLIVNRGVHEPLEEFVFQEVLKLLPVDASMIELGAYWGHYSMWLKLRNPSARVILIEPDNQNLQAGKENFARNGFDGEFINAFVGKGQFVVDEFFKSRNIEHLDILHTDIQGFEVEMLEGAKDTFKRRGVKYAFISTHSQIIHRAAVDELNNLGYRVEVSSDFDTQTTSFDGFIFASSPDVKAVFPGLRVLGREEIAHSNSADVLKNLERIRQG